jgi:sec-independent protein translocase protein TatB
MNLGMSEMIFIFLLALIVFGPRKLPEIGREIGKALAELKRASNEFKSQLENEIEQVNVEEERKKFHDKAQELMQETQAGFSIMPPEHAGVARTLSQAGVTAEDLKAPEVAKVEPPAAAEFTGHTPSFDFPDSDVKASNVQ